MTQLFFTSLESVHGATLICQYKHSTMRVSYTPGLFQDVEMGLTEAKQSVLIIWFPDTTLSKIWYGLDIRLLKGSIFTAEAESFI